jgi:branched-chain amino acid transport system substrate-binding protein
MLSRRTLIVQLPAATLVGSIAARAFAANKEVTIGINLPLTGADAQSALKIKDGAVMAIDEANEAGGAAGYKLNVLLLDDGTATAGQYDPAQAATNARKMVSDDTVVAAIGPQMSGSGKAMAPILSQGDLATITPSSTNPDITAPKFATQYRPAGKAIYFRTVTTDAFQGPNMANYYADTIKVKSVYVLDDSGAYGVGIADTFQGQAQKRGLNVLGRDQLNPKEADYATVLTKIKQLNPDSIYYGGVAQAGVKLVKQAYDILPNTIKVAAWSDKFHQKFGEAPEDYSITAYDAAKVIIDAITRVAAAGKPVNRDTIRDAIQTTKLKTLQGEVSFDENGDLVNKIISVFQIVKDDSKPLDDVAYQYKYMGVAPQSA